MIDLPQDQLVAVKAILEKYAPGRPVMVFGSRVTGRAKPYSDLDLCIMGDGTLTLAALADLRSAFSDSGLPIRVDIVDWNGTEENFQKIIREQAVVLK